MSDPQIWDIVVVGGGPAGMIAAGRAAELGARVLLLERNRTVGKKLLLTGGGRCNITNAISDRHELVARYRTSGTHPGAVAGLHSVFARMSPDSVCDFFRRYGVDTKVEAEGRVFPVSNRAASVRDALVEYMDHGGVTVRPGRRVAAVTTDATDANGTRVTGVQTEAGEALKAGAVILATGGISRPETGSSGDGFVILGSLGHAIREPDAALVPIRTRETWPTRLQGVALPDARVSLAQSGKMVERQSGKLLFTHFGLSGPLILNLSRRIAEHAAGGPVEIWIDLFPGVDEGWLDHELTRLLQEAGKRLLKNVLGSLVPPRVAAAAMELAGAQNVPAASVTRDTRKRIGSTLKQMRCTFDSLLGEDAAVVSSGGVDLREITSATMESRLVQSLYVVGDLLDVDRPSGGFSLQLCWATGWLAGSIAAESQAQSRRQE